VKPKRFDIDISRTAKAMNELIFCTPPSVYSLVAPHVRNRTLPIREQARLLAIGQLDSENNED
jgi:hypothetical protein